MVDILTTDLDAIARIDAVPTILRTIRESTGLRLTLIARVLPDRWVACAVHDELGFGLRRGSELEVATTLCGVVRDSGDPVIIDDVAVDPVYADHPTPRMYGFQSYIAVPIFRRNGEYFGNVCGLDPLPNKLSDPKTLATMRLFCELIALQLESDEKHQLDRMELEAQREAVTLREQFIAVLGHDVRGPLGSIVMGIELLLQKTSDPANIRTLERLRSSSRRIAALVEDLMDLARGRLGGGISIHSANVEDLTSRLRHVVAEVQAVHPARSITFTVTAAGQVQCDGKRIEQLLANLLANAVEHGTPQTPIAVTIGGDDHAFTLSVSNEGRPITDEAKALLFQPFFRGGQGPKSAGLGLGLYIVSEIARSHGGSVDIESSTERTTFTFRMPQRAPDAPTSRREPPVASAAAQRGTASVR